MGTENSHRCADAVNRALRPFDDAGSPIKNFLDADTQRLGNSE